MSDWLLIFIFFGVNFPFGVLKVEYLLTIIVYF